MDFSWNPDKAVSNIRKHGVSFQEAGTVFADPFAITYDDPDHSEQEDRFLTYGMSNQGQLLIVSHTARFGTTRIISARQVTRRERSFYEDAE